MLLLGYLLLGVVAGVLAGLFGVGGGTIIVPGLLASFTLQGIAPEVMTHLAIGTSLGTICLTSLSSIHAHQQRKAVRWDIFFRLTPGLCAGVWLGGTIAAQLTGWQLQKAFGVFALLVGAQMLSGWNPAGARTLPGNPGLLLAGLFIGVSSALFGIGGGALTIPFLLWCGIAMQQAVGTAATGGFPIALIGMLAYMWHGWGNPLLPPLSTGFVYWPALAGIALASTLFARVGARLAHALPPLHLKRFFGGFMIVLGVWFLLR